MIVLCLAFSFRKLDDFDTWWHLAAGRWIVAHGSVPTTDTLSHTVRDHPWIDLQWGFDLVLFLLHQMGGPTILVASAAVGFTLATVLVLRLAWRQVGAVPAAVLGLLAVVAAQDRFEVRPELMSFALLAAVLSIVQDERPAEGRTPWLLVPLMLVWVNVHALFVIGAFAIVCALVGRGAKPSRELVLAGCASFGCLLVNPYGYRGALFPFKLLSRIDGSDPIFQTIGEFRSPFSEDATEASIFAYKILLIVGGAAVLVVLVTHFRRTSGSMLARARGFDWGSLIFFTGLAVLSIMARRNTALFAIGAVPFIARSVRVSVRSLPEAARTWGRRLSPPAGAAATLAAVALIVSVVTGGFYRWDRQAHELGIGVIEGIFPVRAATFAREAKLPSSLYNDVATGGYLAWDDPLGNGVFIDGRLEVYDTAFFSDYVESMYDQDRWQRAADRYGVQTAIIFHHWENRRLLVDRLVRGGIWSLVYADEVAAVFVRTAGNEAALARATALNDRFNGLTRAWLDRPVVRVPYPAGRVEGTRAFARLLATVGDPVGAEETYSNLLALGVPADEEVEVRLLLARRFAATGRVELAKEQARKILALSPGNVEARTLAP